jgi:hypothetical protein
MANVWQQLSSNCLPDFDAMACVLEAKHGLHAAQIADFFSAVHLENGDHDRSGAWADVAERVRERQDQRMSEWGAP